jgi:hypothetical protein
MDAHWYNNVSMFGPATRSGDKAFGFPGVTIKTEPVTTATPASSTQLDPVMAKQSGAIPVESSTSETLSMK